AKTSRPTAPKRCRESIAPGCANDLPYVPAAAAADNKQVTHRQAHRSVHHRPDALQSCTAWSVNDRGPCLVPAADGTPSAAGRHAASSPRRWDPVSEVTHSGQHVYLVRRARVATMACCTRSSVSFVSFSRHDTRDGQVTSAASASLDPISAPFFTAYEPRSTQHLCRQEQQPVPSGLGMGAGPATGSCSSCEASPPARQSARRANPWAEEHRSQRR